MRRAEKQRQGTWSGSKLVFTEDRTVLEKCLSLCFYLGVSVLCFSYPVEHLLGISDWPVLQSPAMRSFMCVLHRRHDGKQHPIWARTHGQADWYQEPGQMRLDTHKRLLLCASLFQICLVLFVHVCMCACVCVHVTIKWEKQIRSVTPQSEYVLILKYQTMFAWLYRTSYLYSEFYCICLYCFLASLTCVPSFLAAPFIVVL